MMRVTWLRQILSHPCSCFSLGALGFLIEHVPDIWQSGDMFLQEGAAEHTLLYSCSQLMVSAGCVLEAGQPHEHSTVPKAISHLQSSQNTAKSGILVCSQLPALEANCLDWQSEGSKK